MKKAIHPAYHDPITVTCSCGNTFETGSTQSEISIEVCSACHPFYTGKSKLIDTAGRVDKFQQRLADAKAKQSSSTKKKDKRKDKPDEEAVVKLS